MTSVLPWLLLAWLVFLFGVAVAVAGLWLAVP